MSFCEDQGLKGKIWTEIVMRKVSFRHRFYQFLIKNYLTQDGWTVNLESRVNGNNKVDIEADYMKKRRIAIEIAVSKFELHDIEKCIQDKNGFDEIRVVCKDETTKKRIENKIFGSNGGKKPDFVFVQTINGLLNSMPQKT